MQRSKVVSNTSPLLNLAFIDRLDLMEDQFSEVLVPEQVWEEVKSGERGVQALEDFRDNGVLKIVSVEEDEFFRELLEDIDIGEAATIRYAIENDVDLVLLDEKDAREVARRHSLEVTGVIGVLLDAAKEDKIDIERSMKELREAGFWISDNLYSEIIKHYS